MQRWRGLDSLPSGWSRCVATIGAFDGVHRGHQELINRAVQLARGCGVPCVLPFTLELSKVTRDIAVKLRGAVYGSEDGTVAALRTQIAALRANRVDTLASYRGHEKHTFPDPSLLRGGIRAEESTIDGLDEVAAALQQTS
nr:hypothetical protein [Mycobacterium haemophilum]